MSHKRALCMESTYVVHVGYTSKDVFTVFKWIDINYANMSLRKPKKQCVCCMMYSS